MYSYAFVYYTCVDLDLIPDQKLIIGSTLSIITGPTSSTVTGPTPVTATGSTHIVNNV